MKKKRYRYLAAAVAMATSAAVLPGYAYAAEEVAAQQETVPAEGSVQADNVAADMAAVSPEEAVETKAADGAENETAATEESAQAPVQVDERTENWNKNRPDEKAIEDLLGQFEGQSWISALKELRKRRSPRPRQLCPCMQVICSPQNCSMRPGTPFTTRAISMIFSPLLRKCRKVSLSPSMCWKIPC